MSGSLDRLEWSTSGLWVLQDFDVGDLYGTFAYDWTNLPINYAARHGWTTNSDNHPEFGAVQDTVGPVGGWGCWPFLGSSGRFRTQWQQCFAAKITTTSPLKATPVDKSTGGVWTTSTTLDELEVATSDASVPAVGTFGFVVFGTNLGGQYPLFASVGGSGGTVTTTWAIITGTALAPLYTVDSIDPATGLSDSVLVGVSAKEINGSTVLEIGDKFEIKLNAADGLYYFFYPEEDCP